NHAIFQPGYFFYAMLRISPSLQPSDIVSVHWHPDARPPYDNLPTYMRLIRDNAGGRQVWLTEVGVENCIDSGQANSYDTILGWFIGEGRTYWPRIFMYELYEPGPCDRFPAAIVRQDWTNRLAFDRYRAWIRSYP